MSIPGPKVPVALAAGLICLVLGVGLALGAGVWGVSAFGYKFSLEKPKEEEKQGEGGPPPNMGMRGGAPGGMRGGAGGPGGGGRGGRGGGNTDANKTRLASLVAKLDVLTHKPLSINLTEEQQKKLQTELKGLDEKEQLSNDECDERLQAILKLLTEDNKETLQEAGFRTQPGGRGGGIGQLPQAPPNPFKTEENAKHLKALQEKAAKPK
jgi:hypothetical protein